MTDSPVVPVELIDVQLVSSRTLRLVLGGLSRRALCKWIRAGILPAPVLIGGANYWRVTIIRAWIAQRVGADAAAALEHRAGCGCAVPAAA